MVTSNLIGGLGNKLFQIATTYSLSLDNNTNCVFEPTNESNDHNNISLYNDNILRNVVMGPTIVNHHYMEPNFHYNEIPYMNNQHLMGYFQSEKYFTHNRGKVLELFSIDDISKKLISDKYGGVLSGNTCSLHVRRGDYLRLPNHHPVCDLSYYNESIELFSGDTTFLVFSDDLPWCREVFSGNFIFIDGNVDYIDMWLMSLCKNNIIANSSFSWWGAWLGSPEGRTVISPTKWFGSAVSHNTKDLIPSNWLRI